MLSLAILKTIRSVVTMLVIAALTLYVYDYYRRHNPQQAVDEAAAIRAQARDLQSQAAQMNRQLQSVGVEAQLLSKELAEQRAAEAYEESRRQQTAALAEGLQRAQALRVAVAESYQTNLQWPNSNVQAGLPAPAMHQGDSLQSASIGPGGVVTLQYDSASGVAGGTVQLVPEAVANGIHWRCETSSYPDIATLIPQCRFVGAAR